MTDPHRIPGGSRVDRRAFLGGGLRGLGGLAALAALGDGVRAAGGRDGLPHFAPRAKRVIFLFQAGGPSQLDLFDPKPELSRRSGELVPASLVAGERLAQLRGRELRLVGSRYRFAQHGEAGTWVSELLPHLAGEVDRLSFVHSMHTEAINHDPGMTMMQTGAQQPGRPSMGSWVDHGLGSENADLPGFVVLISGGKSGDQPLYARLWGSGFLPGAHAGVPLRGGRDPVLFLQDPAGSSRAARERFLDALRRLEEREFAATGDPAVTTRVAAYEMALRMQRSVPDLVDLGDEPPEVLEEYGAVPGERSFATHCLLARRMVERGVRFVQLYHRGWDHHEGLPRRIEEKCRETDRPTAALLRDLARRGLLDDTLVVWGGEFGRTPMNQGSMAAGNYGRDHHGLSFTVFLAGGGVRAGVHLGATDDLGYRITERPVHVHDLHATILHLLGVDHLRLTWRHQGRDFRLTDVAGEVVPELLA